MSCPADWVLHSRHPLSLHHHPHVDASGQLQGPLPSLHHRGVEGEGRPVRGGLGESGLLQLHHIRGGRHVRHLRHPDIQDQHVPIQEQGQQFLQCVRGRDLEHLHVQHDPHRRALHHARLQRLVRGDDQEVRELR